MKLVKKTKILLAIILLVAAFLRFYGLNWDQGYHLHPDERAIVMFTTPLQFPKTLDEFLSPQSPWNPHFFAYGNFPLYLLKTTSYFLANLDPLYAVYEKINLVGRAISAIADIGTIILIYLLAKKLFSKKVGLLSAFFYAVSVFPIQTAHFFAVDTLLTFFITLTLYQLIRFYEKPSITNSSLAGIFFGLSLATKVSAAPLVVAIFAAIAVDFALLVIKQPHKLHIWFPHVPRFLKRLIFDGVIISIATVITFAVLQPYAIINFEEFLRQTQQQSQMTRDAFTFPYTLQYVGKTPYFYELKNIFLWGLGPILATLSFLGFAYITTRVFKTFYSSSEGAQATESRSFSSRRASLARTVIILSFFLVYFLIVGNFKVGWMRYMLLLYPLLAIFAAVVATRLFESIMNLRLNKFSIFNFQIGLFVIMVFIGSILIWPISFMHIYTKPNTRVQASQWIYENIPPNKIIAREHWDDGLPIGGNIFYQTLELPIYDIQNPFIETQIYQTIQQADYIIIASNRLYAPLQRISKNCKEWKVPQDRCPHNARRYYEKLFSGELGYKKVAEFTSYPKLKVGSLELIVNDSSADESFTVYDHPKVMIFKKQNNE